MGVSIRALKSAALVDVVTDSAIGACGGRQVWMGSRFGKTEHPASASMPSIAMIRQTRDAE
jgi:hypothetical protein